MGKRLSLAALILCLLLLAACASAQELQGGEAAQWTYPVSLKGLDEEYIRLANRDTLLPSDYAPKDLVKISVKKTSSSSIQMREAASEALSAMFSAALDDGLTLYAHSGYRSYQTQNTMYKNRLERNGGKDDGAVAYPGASDHQTGLGIDVISKSWIGNRFNENFAKEPEAQWMAAHCAEYGFIIRYPEDKVDITEIMYEPWHLRYVGMEAAKYIMGSGICLEEFTVEWQQALADFQAAGGDVNQAQIEQTLPVGEANQNQAEQKLPKGEVVLNEQGADGDFEVTLFH